MQVLKFDVGKLNELKRVYEENIKFVLENMPQEVNWNKPTQVKEYFKKRFDISLPSCRIKDIEPLISRYEDEDFDIVYGYLTFLRLKWTMNNYIDCVLRHHVDGTLALREDGTMPNKRPVSLSKEINDCLI